MSKPRKVIVPIVAATTAHGVLVAAEDHEIDLIQEDDYEETSFTGINYMKIELDFEVS